MLYTTQHVLSNKWVAHAKETDQRLERKSYRGMVQGTFGNQHKSKKLTLTVSTTLWDSEQNMKSELFKRKTSVWNHCLEDVSGKLTKKGA